MITMEMLGKVRRMHLRDKLSLREITKLTGLSRNTVRGWLRKPEDPVKPTYRRSETAGKLTPFHEALELALKVDSHRTKQHRRTARALYAADQGPGVRPRVQSHGEGGARGEIRYGLRHSRLSPRQKHDTKHSKGENLQNQQMSTLIHNR